jgi:hypothetical protein
MRRLLAVFAMASALTMAPPASADEMWTSPGVGAIIWETDIGQTSVFSYQTESGATVKMYIDGLNANIENRRVMTGYWMIPGDGPEDALCSAQITAPDGATSMTWGHFTMRWQRRAFPSGWTAQFTDCFAGQRSTMRATPVVGE